MSDLRGIIFDFNGVLLWDSRLHVMAWNECARKIRGREFSEEEIEHRMHGRTNGDILEYLAGRPLKPTELLHYIHQKESIYQRLCLEHKEELKLAPGVPEFLDYLKAHHKPATIATSSSPLNLKFYYEHLPLDRWFTYDRVAYDDGTMQGKPAPDLFLKAAKNLGLDPSECIVIEDARSGITAAYRAGIGKIIAIGPEQNQRALAAIEGVDETISNFEDLLKNWDSLWTKK